MTESAAESSRRDAMTLAQRFIAGNGEFSRARSPGGTEDRCSVDQSSLRDWIVRLHVSPAMNRWAILDRPSGAVCARASSARASSARASSARAFAKWINRLDCQGPGVGDQFGWTGVTTLFRSVTLDASRTRRSRSRIGNDAVGIFCRVR